MPRKICAIIFCTALLVFAALFTSTAAVAQEDDCLPPNSFRTISGYTVTLTEGPVKVKLEFPIGSSNFIDRYRYTYQVNKIPSQFNIAFPTCCPDTIDVKGVDPGFIYPPGIGEPTNSWLYGYFQAFVARVTPNQDKYIFYVNTSTIGETSVCLKVKNKLECGAIAGPVCQEDASSPTLVEIMGPDKFLFAKSDPALKCYDLVYGCGKEDSDATCLSNPLTGRDVSDIKYGGVPVTIVTSEQKCITYIQFGEGSTRCPTIGGKTYCR